MIRINQLKLSIEHNESDIRKVAAERLKIKIDMIKDIKLIKRSLDARKKDEMRYIYSVDIAADNEEDILKKKKAVDIMKSTSVEYTSQVSGTEKIKQRPVIIGSGPAGIFCAYFLALYRYCPLIIERGEPVDERTLSVQTFWDLGILNEESNVQFGEGGAGTFSDGKLNTMNKDTYGRIKKVLEVFAENGAPSEILYLNKPHIGTDYLKLVVKNIRNKIVELGGEYRFNTKLIDIEEENKKIVRIKTECFGKIEAIKCNTLILAIGHSARDTFYKLYNKGLKMEAKAFAAGIRIEHEQDFIDKAQYKINRGKLPAADYKLTHQCRNGRGVYTFCMCPGGFVVNASSEAGRLTVNGMSNYSRSERNANSAIIATVTPEDFISETGDTSALAGIGFQRKYEELAYKAADGAVPIQLLRDLIAGRKGDTIGHVIPSIKGKYVMEDIRKCLPSYLIESIIEGIYEFDKKIKGFADGEAVLCGVEMRTSSPIRILRNEDFTASIDGIYPCGEGAGYAGGITSAAVDGIKVFESIVKKYKP